ncbi:MAG: aminotransferase class IV [Candidatus Pacebacteria bacterium]|nr:aminotransferase class IV [Candidatus Paceibacterota bacterium]
MKYFEKSILDFIKKNDYIDTDYYIRPLIYISDLGLSPNLNANKSLLIYGVELGDYLSNNGVNVCVSSYRRQEDNMIPGRGKISGSYYISSAAKAEALDRGFDEAILLNMSGKVSEGSAMNIFMVRDSTLYTTLGTDNILEGITRRSIIEIANLLKIKFIERQIDISELMYVAEEVFFSGTAAKMTMVNKIEGKAVSKERVIFNKINKELENVFAGKSILSKK